MDDEPSVVKTLGVVLKRAGSTLTASNAEEAIKSFNSTLVDLVLLDIRLPGTSGLEVLKKIKEKDESTMVIMISALHDAKTAVEAMKLGAYDYITKPFDAPEVRALVAKALEKNALIKNNLFLQSELNKVHPYDSLVWKSERMKEVFDLTEKASQVNGAVLIMGESGTGKELVARAIHLQSKKHGSPFVAINCAGIPENLLESELFGHEPGAFTGAMERKEGKFEVANGGIVFLDEICSMPLALQAKLLRVLQEKKDGTKEIERVGSSRPIPIDVRIISATNRDIKKALEEGRFREDLYYRLNMFPINLPPLRERKEDIPLLVEYFLNVYNNSLNKRISGFTKEAMDAFLTYAWPGNVRELKNVIERLVSLNNERVIPLEELPVDILAESGQGCLIGSELDSTLSMARNRLEVKLIKKALIKTEGNQIKAAQLLGMHRNTLASKIKTYRLGKGISFRQD